MTRDQDLPEDTDGVVVPFEAARKTTYKDALVDQLVAKAIAAQNRRALAILDSEEAKGRRSLAHHLIFQTDMPAEDAIAVLARAGVEKPADGLEAFFRGKARETRR